MFGVRDSTGTWRDVIPVGYSLTHRPCSHCSYWSRGLGSGLILGFGLLRYVYISCLGASKTG
ncbi:Bgt-51592 [Blumeria graminis f. sp. tritici]|uniref:Bgt-51592 n=1 Tax=Blumeria graminis f. sp. tritici TaxID=62690 RepID=A0A9X9QFP2_BLUGR|nr:Bgt-51592 [Blumeria graminis f. sp. tritici]